MPLTNSMIFRLEATPDCYPFGMPMPGRSLSLSNYRFGFNGKENDNEIKGEGNWQNYGMRLYDPRLGRFPSVDPLFKKYPELSTYQFASNRSIDGVDLDGLEYATFTIFVQYGKVTNISVAKDYELKDKNTLGPGIKYNYAYLDKEGKIERFEAKPLVTNIYGIYQGRDNPQLPAKGGDPKKLFDTYELEPIDETDANAKQHDQDYDKENLKGLSGVLDHKSSKANIDYIERANKTVDKQNKGEKDIVTGKPVTKAAANAAKFGMKGFGIAEGVKNSKMEKGPKQ